MNYHLTILSCHDFRAEATRGLRIVFELSSYLCLNVVES